MDKLDPSHEIDEPEGLKPENELPQPEGLDPEHELESHSTSSGSSTENQRIGPARNASQREAGGESEKSESTHDLAETRAAREEKESSITQPSPQNPHPSPLPEGEGNKEEGHEDRMEKIEEDYKKSVELSGSGSSKMKVILAAVFALFATLAVLFYFFSDEIFKEEEDVVVPSPVPTAALPIPTQAPILDLTLVDTTTWKTYSDPKLNFSVKYPPTWKVNPPQDPSPLLVSEVNLSGPQGSFLLLFGSGFGGGCDNWEQIQIANEMMHVCRVQLEDGSESWGGFSKTISPEVGVMGRATINSPIEQNRGVVETILSTLNFQTNTQVACTMDAKLCPDGSSVGRTGPNCEFAPCPGN